MYAGEIELYVNCDQQIAQYFSGIYDIRGIMPVYVRYPSSFIFNIGEHWVAVFIDKFQRGEYFDSCGLPPPYTMFKFMENTCNKWKYNSERVQSQSSSFCGHYALMFLRHRSMNQEFNDFIYNFRSCNDLEKDDRIYNLFTRTYGHSNIHLVENTVKKMEKLVCRMEKRDLWK